MRDVIIAILFTVLISLQISFYNKVKDNVRVEPTIGRGWVLLDNDSIVTVNQVGYFDAYMINGDYYTKRDTVSVDLWLRHAPALYSLKVLEHPPIEEKKFGEDTFWLSGSSDFIDFSTLAPLLETEEHLIKEIDTIKLYCCIYCGKRTCDSASIMCDTCFLDAEPTAILLEAVMEKANDPACDNCNYIAQLAGGEMDLVEFTELCDKCETEQIERSA